MLDEEFQKYDKFYATHKTTLHYKLNLASDMKRTKLARTRIVWTETFKHLAAT